MTTNDQERKALEQIKKIVESLGEDSYIGMALEGCLDDAETNIENDWALSMNGRWQDAEQKFEVCKREKDELVEENKRLKEDFENLLERTKELREEVNNLSNTVLKERKDVTINTENGQEVKPFAEVNIVNADGFHFVTVIEQNGFATSYKMDDIKTIEIR